MTVYKIIIKISVTRANLSIIIVFVLMRYLKRKLMYMSEEIFFFSKHLLNIQASPLNNL